ncbi:MAG TPA: hypothetical protein P5532_24690 [Planctomycetota bacterium]|nr:hypothetical protein [Planctomycetota bacterium]HRT97618.1 hypothetical protein [Planctomycetota bacterium]
MDVDHEQDPLPRLLDHLANDILESRPVRVLSMAAAPAHLVMLPDTDPRARRVINRKSIVDGLSPGTVVIHARSGLGGNPRMVNLLSRDEQLRLPRNAYVGVAEIVTVRHVTFFWGLHDDRAAEGRRITHQLHWVASHPYTIGPWCVVLRSCRAFRFPVHAIARHRRTYELPSSHTQAIMYQLSLLMEAQQA